MFCAGSTWITKLKRSLNSGPRTWAATPGPAYMLLCVDAWIELCEMSVNFDVIDSRLVATVCWLVNLGARITLAPSTFQSAPHSRTPPYLSAGNLASTVIGPALQVRASFPSCSCTIVQVTDENVQIDQSYLPESTIRPE